MRVGIAFGNGVIQVESPLVEGGLALTPKGAMDWAITHVPTGRLVSGTVFRNLAMAERALRELLPLADWAGARNPTGFPPETVAAVQRVLAAVAEADARVSDFTADWSPR